jgi:hypothetical protein
MADRTVQARVVFNEAEGGFWGLVTDQGERLLPTEPLPESYQVPDLNVKAHIADTSAVSLQMWGKPVSVLSLIVQ